MKQLIILNSFFLLLLSSNAQQKNTFEIKNGTVLNYAIYPPGLSVNYSFTVDSVSSDHLAITWTSESGRVGQFIMNEASMKKATKGYWWPPQAGTSTIVENDQLVLNFSSTLWQQLEQNKKVEFDGILYSLKQQPDDQPMILNNKVVDALYLKSEVGNEIWLLNNPTLPLILKIKNNPEGVDAEIMSINS